MKEVGRIVARVFDIIYPEADQLKTSIYPGVSIIKIQGLVLLLFFSLMYSIKVSILLHIKFMHVIIAPFGPNLKFFITDLYLIWVLISKSTEYGKNPTAGSRLMKNASVSFYLRKWDFKEYTKVLFPVPAIPAIIKHWSLQVSFSNVYCIIFYNLIKDGIFGKQGNMVYSKAIFGVSCFRFRN